LLLDNKGLVECIPSNEALKYGLGYHDRIIADVANKGDYYPVPLKPWGDIVKDVKAAEDKSRRLLPLEIPPQGLLVENAPQVTPEARVTPEERKRSQLMIKIENDPEGIASHIEDIETRLAEKREKSKFIEENIIIKDNEINHLKKNAKSLQVENSVSVKESEEKGLSRTSLISDSWHSRHPQAALFLFGIPNDWIETKIFLCEGLFPDMKPIGRRTGPLTEFEQVIITLMRMRRGYELLTLACIFGKSKTCISRTLDKWLPIMGCMGRYMSILDIDKEFD
jgi:hypothetical protein